MGRRIAEFHDGADRPADPERAVAALEEMLAENFATLRELHADRAAVADAERFAAAMLDGRRRELLERARNGRVRDGHGDLRAEHVVLERGIEIVDCVEFDPGLREIDVGLDLGFLAMDLLRRDEPLAAALVAAYREAGGDPGDDDLVAFFAAQRALIRAKVALVRAGQVDGADARRRRADAEALLALAGRLAWRVRVGAATIVCGPAAGGKSTVAAALAERTGASVLASDVVRKQLLEIAPTARAPQAAYEPAMNRRTYQELGRRARELVDAGERAIVDATFRFEVDRQSFLAVFGTHADLTWIECRAPVEVRARRAAERSRQPDRASDAGTDIALLQTEEWQPLTAVAAARHVVLRTDHEPDEVVASLREQLDVRLTADLRG